MRSVSEVKGEKTSAYRTALPILRSNRDWPMIPVGVRNDLMGVHWRVDSVELELMEQALRCLDPMIGLMSRQFVSDEIDGQRQPLLVVRVAVEIAVAMDFDWKRCKGWTRCTSNGFRRSFA